MKTLLLGPLAIKEAINTLHNGGLVIAPSDTVYGALVDARNPQAVKKLIAFKNRPWGKPISVFVSDLQMMGEYVYINKSQKKVLNELLPGPFTVILDSKHKVDVLLESEKGALGVRYIDYPFISVLIREYKGPVTATSANISGRPAHYSTDSLLADFPRSKRDLIDLIVDGGKLPRNKPSTVMDITMSKIKIVRKGDVNREGNKLFITKSAGDTEKTAQFLVKKYVTGYDKPFVCILQGPMGVGKTIFVKGVGKIFGIQNIISPTFVVSYEYDIKKQGVKKLIHCDFFNITDQEEFNYLGLEQYLVPGNMLFIEWGEKSGPLFEVLKKKSSVLFVKMEYGKGKEREIRVSS